jgi:glutamate--cysteine ligase
MRTRDLYLAAAVENARKNGGTVKLMSKKPLVLDVTYADGVSFRTKNTKPPLNSEKIRDALKDKMLTGQALEYAGLPTPRTHLIEHGDIPDGNKAALRKSKAYKKIRKFIKASGGYPVFIKPNKGSLGRDVFRVDSAKNLDAVLMRVVSKKKEDFIVQEACVGEEYRIIVIDGHIELALRKEPLKVKGDGQNTIHDLVKTRFDELREQGRKVHIKPDSPKIASHLEKQGLSPDYVLQAGREIVVLANKNLSDGASPVVCTEDIRAKYGDLCARVCKDLRIRYGGIDLMENERHNQFSPEPSILEINGKRGFMQFIHSAPDHPDIVKKVFSEGFAAAHRLGKQKKLPGQAHAYPEEYKFG